MTKAELRRIVRVWQKRLGMERWDITVAFNEYPENSYATMMTAGSYEVGVLTFSPGWESWSADVANQTVVHELMHAQVRGIDSVVEAAKEQMHPQGAAQLESRYHYEIEGLVDRMAYRMVELGGCA